MPVLTVKAEDIWVGDAVNEGQQVIGVKDGGGVVHLQLGALGPGPEYDLTNTGKKTLRRGETIRVVRGVRTRGGSYLTQYDIRGHCHGHCYPPGNTRHHPPEGHP